MKDLPLGMERSGCSALLTQGTGRESCLAKGKKSWGENGTPSTVGKIKRKDREVYGMGVEKSYKAYTASLGGYG